MLDTTSIVNGFYNLSKSFERLAEVAREVHEKGFTDSPEGEVVLRARAENGWFDPSEIAFAAKHWAQAMGDENQVKSWLDPQNSLPVSQPKRVGVIMAGNIPFVGLHDALSVLVSGHSLMAKMSSEDSVLMQWAFAEISKAFPLWEKQFEQVEKLNDAEAVIATGSDNTARYFEYYFSKVPHIIRKNRTSVAVLDGDETSEEIKALGEDLFRYFGLGCRNVTKLYLPKGFDLDRLFGQWVDFGYVHQNKKYANNYDYHKAIHLMNKDTLLENGFVMLMENPKLGSAVSMLHYEYYEDLAGVEAELKNQESSIQCVVSHNAKLKGALPFGEAQRPNLSQYADGVDTLAFLSVL
ncbi:MAG: acyl-CoA reductase [Schleiferiaceae bacterium]